jgi:hypothetical protein
MDTHQLNFPNKKNKPFLRFCGHVIMIMTLGALFSVYYGTFFERRLFYNRKYLLKYLEQNPKALSEPYGSGIKHWKIDDYEITLNNDNEWYIFMYRTHSCFMCSFITDKRDQKTYDKIKQMLMDNAN